MNIMPEEVICHIVSFLPLEQMFLVRRVNSCWKLAGDRAIGQVNKLMIAVDDDDVGDSEYAELMVPEMLSRLWQVSCLSLFRSVEILTVKIPHEKEDNDAIRALLKVISKTVVKITLSERPSEWLAGVFESTTFPLLTELNGCNLSDIMAAVVKACPKLLAFDVQSRQMFHQLPEKTDILTFGVFNDWLSMKMLTKFKDLHSLKIVNCGIDGHDLPVAHFPHLIHISIRDSELCINDKLIAFIANSCPRIRHLDLCNRSEREDTFDGNDLSCALTGAAIDSLIRMSCLKDVVIRSSHWFLDEGSTDWSRLAVGNPNQDLRFKLTYWGNSVKYGMRESVHINENLHFICNVMSFKTRIGKLVEKGILLSSIKKLRINTKFGLILSENCLISICKRYSQCLEHLLLPLCCVTDKVLTAFGCLNVSSLHVNFIGNCSLFTAEGLVSFLEKKSSDGTLEKMKMGGLVSGLFSHEELDRISAVSKKIRLLCNWGSFSGMHQNLPYCM